MTTFNNLVSKIVPKALKTFSTEPLVRVDHKNLPADTPETKVDSGFNL